MCTICGLWDSDDSEQHSRHDPREVKHLWGKVRQIGIEEDKERGDDLGPGGKTWGEGCQQAEEETYTQAPDSDHHHPAAPQQNIQPWHWWQTEEGLKKLVEHLRGRNVYEYQVFHLGTWHTHRFSPHHSDGVIEQWLSKHQDMQLFVNLHLLENRKHRHWVYSSDQGAKQQAVEQRDIS